METEKKTSRMPQIGEAVFCIMYLLFDLAAAVIFFVKADGSPALRLFGLLTLVLGGGDAFHLVPRIIKAFLGDSPAVEWWSGLGLMVSSITMTVFYLLLFYVWRNIFPETVCPPVLFGGFTAICLLRLPGCVWRFCLSCPEIREAMAYGKCPSLLPLVSRAIFLLYCLQRRSRRWEC